MGEQHSGRSDRVDAREAEFEAAAHQVDQATRQLQRAEGLLVQADLALATEAAAEALDEWSLFPRVLKCRPVREAGLATLELHRWGRRAAPCRSPGPRGSAGY